MFAGGILVFSSNAAAMCGCYRSGMKKPMKSSAYRRWTRRFELSALSSTSCAGLKRALSLHRAERGKAQAKPGSLIAPNYRCFALMSFHYLADQVQP